MDGARGPSDGRRRRVCATGRAASTTGELAGAPDGVLSQTTRQSRLGGKTGRSRSSRLGPSAGFVIVLRGPPSPRGGRRLKQRAGDRRDGRAESKMPKGADRGGGSRAAREKVTISRTDQRRSRRFQQATRAGELPSDEPGRDRVDALQHGSRHPEYTAFAVQDVGEV